MAPKENPLQKQLDHQKFLHAIQYMRTAANGIKRLTTTELSRTNEFLSGSDSDPWRFDSVEIQIPGGKRHKVNVHSNPISRAREILGNAIDMAANDKIFEAATYLYSHLVLEHLFKVANRRTAVAAIVWILENHGYECDAEALLETPIGDLRDPSDLSSLEDKIKKFSKRS